MNTFQSMNEAVRVAKQILAGEIGPNIGCDIIYRIGKALDYPSELGAFSLLGHEQYDHEHIGITAESCVPDIL
ncbi:MAG: hypothetical protein IPP88_22390, partial [Betaproteobacteria bacterium]|nr:hypothetical protein [Betaproteobacteria bacterium]